MLGLQLVTSFETLYNYDIPTAQGFFGTPYMESFLLTKVIIKWKAYQSFYLFYR